MIPAFSEIQIEQIHASRIHEIEFINNAIFNESRIINRTDQPDLIILKACIKDIIIGFKVGYGRKNSVFYSAKGGVLPDYRRQGIARHLLIEMMNCARLLGYKEFQYDTFPNLHHGMLILGLKNGFSITEARFNAQYKDFQITLTKAI